MLFCVAGGIVNYKFLEEIHTLRNVFFSYIQQIFSVNTYLGTTDFFNWEIFLCKFMYMFYDYKTHVCLTFFFFFFLFIYLWLCWVFVSE